MIPDNIKSTNEATQGRIDRVADKANRRLWGSRA